MGGVIIILSIVVPVLLFAKLESVYIILLIISTLWTGLIGFLDDYIKVFRKNKEGLKGRFKIVGQIGLGLIVGLTLYFNSNVVVREFNQEVRPENVAKVLKEKQYKDTKSHVTTIPFFKHNELDYDVRSEVLVWLVSKLHALTAFGL